MNDAAVLDRLVPITTFNKGGASKVFERAASVGPVFVLKNNVPAGVVVSPEEYARLSEVEEDYLLLLEAMERLQDPENAKTYTQAEVMEELGIASDDLDSIEDLEIG